METPFGQITPSGDTLTDVTGRHGADLGKARDEATWLRHAYRPGFADHDPAVRRSMRLGGSPTRPLYWTRWRVVGTVVGAVLAGVLVILFAGGDDLVFGRVLLASIGGALLGWLTIVVLARLGTFRTVDEL